MIAHTRQTALDSKLPVFIAEGRNQQGNSFGHRLANEVETIFDSGFEKVIIIGNDCPELTTLQLHQANQLCQSDQVVLGPTSDGGAYLIAFHKKHFEKSTFINLDWETANFHASFQAYLQAQNVGLELLVELQDIDDPEQLKAILARLCDSHPFKKFIKYLIRDFHFNGFSYSILIPQISKQFLFLSRAP